MTLACSCEVPETVFEQPVSIPLYQITLEAVDAKGIRGWAWDANAPDRPVEVIVYDGNEILERVVADEFRQDLQAAGKGNGRHGFVVPIPAKLCDGREHLIHAQIPGESPLLHVAPRSFTCGEPGGIDQDAP